MYFWTVLIFVSFLILHKDANGQCVAKKDCEKGFFHNNNYYDSFRSYRSAGCEEGHSLVLECQNVTSLDAAGITCGRFKCWKAAFFNSNIPHLALGKLRSLIVKTLYLNNTHLETMEVGCFSNLESIENLHLEDNKLKEINRGIFNALSNMKKLSLGNNLITLIEDNAFSGAFKLNQFYLRNNHLQNIPSQVFSGLSELVILDVSYNQLQTINFNLSTCLHLSKLYLQHNKIVTIISHLPPNLNDLDVSENKLTLLGPITKLSNLTSLYINNNELNNIPIGSMKFLKNLTLLNMSHNAITTLSYGALAGLKNVTNFDISYNDLDNVDEKTFFALKSLQILNVSYTKIKQISVQGLAAHSKNLRQITTFGLFLTCLELSEIMIEADLKNITIEEGVENETDHIIGISCTRTKPDSNSRKGKAKDVVNNYFDKEFEKSSFYTAITDIAKLLSQNSTIKIQQENSANTDAIKTLNSLLLAILKNITSIQSQISTNDVKTYLKNIDINTKEANEYIEKMFDYFDRKFKNLTLYNVIDSNDSNANDLKFGKIMNVLEQILVSKNIQPAPQMGRLENDVSMRLESSMNSLKTTATVFGCLFFVIWFGTLVFKLFSRQVKNKITNLGPSTEMQLIEN